MAIPWCMMVHGTVVQGTVAVWGGSWCTEAPHMLYPSGPNFFRSNIKLWKWHSANKMDLAQ